MQLRCTYCQTMFAISRDETLAALQHLEVHKQKYYDAHCPKCRRANRVDGWRLEISMPDWKKQIRSMEIEASQEAKETPKPAGATSVRSAQAPGKATPAVKKPLPAKPAARKPAPAGAKVKAPAKPVAAVKKPTTKKLAAKTPVPSKPAKVVGKKPAAGKVKGKATSGLRKK